VSEQQTKDRLLAALNQAALQPSLSRVNFEAIRDAVHLIEDQRRTIAGHVDLMARLKDHMERMGFCTREEEPYLEELDEAIQKATQS
jgi:hypothetical protein